MFLTAKDLGLSQHEVNKINERLWKEREPLGKCPDCQVNPGEIHLKGCDVAHCLNCGQQTIFWDCCENIENDIWSGLWPGVKECYEQKLICFDTCKYPSSNEYIGWCFDLNTLTFKKQK